MTKIVRHRRRMRQIDSTKPALPTGMPFFARRKRTRRAIWSAENVAPATNKAAISPANRALWLAPDTAAGAPSANLEVGISHSKQKNNLEKDETQTYDYPIDITSTIVAAFAGSGLDPEHIEKCALRAAAAIELEKAKIDQPSQNGQGVASAFADVADNQITVEIPAPGNHVMFPGRPVNPETFFAEHWAEYVPHGLTQALLRKRDSKLMKSLENRYVGRKDILTTIIPTRATSSSKMFLNIFGSEAPPPGSIERDKALGAIRLLKSSNALVTKFK